jgi:hypothetical protein
MRDRKPDIQTLFQYTLSIYYLLFQNSSISQAHRLKFLFDLFIIATHHSFSKCTHENAHIHQEPSGRPPHEQKNVVSFAALASETTTSKAPSQKHIPNKHYKTPRRRGGFGQRAHSLTSGADAQPRAVCNHLPHRVGDIIKP